MTRRTSSAVSLWTGPKTDVMALFTHTSMGPRVSLDLVGSTIDGGRRFGVPFSGVSAWQTSGARTDPGFDDLGVHRWVGSGRKTP